MSSLHDLILALPKGATLEIHSLADAEADRLVILSFCVRLPGRRVRLCGELAVSPTMRTHSSSLAAEIDSKAATLLADLRDGVPA